jgi:ribosomal protein S18 acetylase RimI-like enzyme
VFTTASLAARIERAECTMLTEIAQAAITNRGQASVVLAPIAGGVATYVAPGSPVNKFAGLGFDGVPAETDLTRIEQAFADRQTPLQVELSSLGDPAVGRLLTTRGYQLIGFENVLGLPLDPSRLEDAGHPSVTIEQAGPADVSAWIDAVVTGFMHPDTFDGPPTHESFDREAITGIFDDITPVASVERYLARRDGVVAGGGSLRLDQGVAQLAGAATLPAHRRHGVQSMLLRHRLREAARRGCDIAVVTTQPGSKSIENVQKFGFAILYVRAILVKAPAAS